MDCYRFQKLTFDTGLYDSSIDATYILTMEDSKERHSNILEQLQYFHPTHTVYIVYNKGFLKCNKNLTENKSNIDLIHFYLNTFKHSIQNQYSNILVLEDDFIAEPSVNDDICAADINEFCSSFIDDKYTLSLGSIPVVSIPYSLKFNISYVSLGTHAVVYSKKYRQYVLDHADDVYESMDWDIYMNNKLIHYNYYKPVITQIFSETDNKKNWDNRFGLTDLATKIINLLKLDKQSQPGFNILYILSVVLHILIPSVCILILYILIRYIIKIVHKNNK